MVDEKSSAYRGARMDLDPRKGTRRLTYQACGEVRALFVCGVGEAVKHQRVESRIQKRSLCAGTRGGVSLHDRVDVVFYIVGHRFYPLCGR